MEEYIILEKSISNFQKILNQWKHEYSFKILWMDFNGKYDGYYRALIKRWKKEFI